MITSKRHPFRFYLAIFFSTLFFIGWGSLVIYMFYDIIAKGSADFKAIALLLLGLGLFFMAFYTVIQYARNAPKIRVDKTTISFGSKKYDLRDIKEIILTGKMPFRYLVIHPMEGALLVFKDNTKRFIFNDMYSNTWQIKSFLEKTVIEKQEYKEPENTVINPNKIRFLRAEDFKGAQWSSLGGITLWGIIGFFLIFLLSTDKVHSYRVWLVFLAISTIWFLVYSYLMDYFSLTNDYLIIKNHNLFWRKRIYKITDIKEVVFETQGKLPNCLRVITNDYRNELYRAGTLRDKTWIEFQNRLEKLGIPVRNECIY